MGKKVWRLWLLGAVALGFLYLFFRGAELHGIVRAVAGANYFLAVPAVLAYFAGVWFRAIRWRLLLSPLGRFPVHRLFSPIVIGFALNNLLPGRVGLVARAYMVGRREQVSKVASGATVALDQLFDGVALLFLMAVATLFVSLPGWARPLVAVTAGLYGGLLLLLWLMALFPEAVQRMFQPVRRRLPRGWGPRVGEWLDLGLWGVRSLRSPGRLALVFVLSLLVWLAEAGLFYFLAQAFHISIPFYSIVFVLAIATLALLFPSLPGGIGPFEYFGKQALLLFEVRETVATAYMGIAHLTQLLPVTVLGLGLLWWQRLPLGKRAVGKGP